MLRRALLASVGLTLVVLLTAGCSWVTMNKLPSNWRAETPPRCSESRLAPIADMVVGSGVASAAFGVGSAVSSRCNANCELGYLLTGAIVTAALVQWFAATDGFRYAARCRAAGRERQRFKRGY